MTLHVDNPDNLPEAEVAQYVARAEDLISRGELPADTESETQEETPQTD